MAELVDCTALEMRRPFGVRGFESLCFLNQFEYVMKFKVKMKAVSMLSNNKLRRVYESGFRYMTKRHSLVRVLVRDFRTYEDVNSLLEQLHKESKVIEQDMHSDFPKLPRKFKKKFKKQLGSLYNAYCIGCTLLMDVDGL